MTFSIGTGGLMSERFFRVGLWPGTVEFNGGTDEILQRSFIDDIVFVEVNGAGHLGFQARIEETMRIIQRCPLEKVDLDIVLESSNSNNIFVARPHRCIPFPFFDNSWGSIENQLAQSCKHLAAPIREFVNVVGDFLGCRHRLRTPFTRGTTASDEDSLV